MFLHLSVSHSVHRRCLPHTPPGRPPGQTPPGHMTPPLFRHPLGTHPRADTPSAQCMLVYGQQAGGTHPTGMHTSDTNIGIIANFVQFVKNSIHAKIMAANTCENVIVKEL